MKTTIFAGLIFSLLVMSACTKGAEGFATATNCQQYGCRLTLGEAKFDSKVEDDNGGCVFDCSADVYVKNLENQPALAKVTATCRTLNKVGEYSSEEFWLQPQGSHTFKINVDAGIDEDWKCENFAIHSSQIAGCEMYKI